MLKALLNDNIDILSKSIADYIYEHITSGEVDKFEGHKSLDLICFDWYDTLDTDTEPSQITIYFNKNDLFFICENERGLAMVEKLVKEERTHERTLYRFFTRLLDGDTDVLEALEDEITELDDELLTTSKKDCAHEIVEFRHKLLCLKKYYEQLNKIFINLVENDNGLIAEDELKYFKILDSRVDRLFANVLNLRDYSTQVREAYQSQVDIELNSIMKTFTIVTAIFLPLTLLVGWYGMNLKMPEFEWQYGYPVIIGVSILIIASLIIMFKKKKWF